MWKRALVKKKIQLTDGEIAKPKENAKAEMYEN